MNIRLFKNYPVGDRILVCVAFLVDENAESVLSHDSRLNGILSVLSKLLKDVGSPIKNMLLLSLIQEALTELGDV